MASAQPDSELQHDVAARLAEWQVKRDEDATRMYNAVTTWSTRFAGFGVVVTAASVLMPDLIIENFVYAAGISVMASSVIVLSTTPLKLTDLDRAFRHRVTAYLLGLAICAAYASLALSTIAYALPAACGLLVVLWPHCRQTGWQARIFAPTKVVSMTLVLTMVSNAVKSTEQVGFVYAISHMVVNSSGCMVVTYVWMPQVHRQWFARSATGRFFASLYAWLAVESLISFLTAIMEAVLNDASRIFIVSIIAYAMAYGAPVAVLTCFGRKRLFTFAAVHFDRDIRRGQQDGAFIAGLLDQQVIRVGQDWFIRNGEEWSCGSVVEVTEHDFAVKVSKTARRSSAMQLQDHADETIRVALRTMCSPTELLTEAKAQLRAVNMTKVSQDLLLTSSSSSACDAISDLVEVGSLVDRFLTHSWHDDGIAKYTMLSSFGAEFQVRHGRQPTFWIDKFCINQDNIKDGLRMLPVNIMSCRKVLVAWGKTYATRLWCVWELFTVVAFTGLEASMGRFEFRPLSCSWTQMREQLQSFDVSKAKCFDPNEERRLRRIIYGLGNSLFNSRIQELGWALPEGPSSSIQSSTIGKARSLFTKATSSASRQLAPSSGSRSRGLAGERSQSADSAGSLSGAGLSFDAPSNDQSQPVSISVNPLVAVLEAEQTPRSESDSHYDEFPLRI